MRTDMANADAKLALRVRNAGRLGVGLAVALGPRVVDLHDELHHPLPHAANAPTATWDMRYAARRQTAHPHVLMRNGVLLVCGVAAVVRRPQAEPHAPVLAVVHRCTHFQCAVCAEAQDTCCVLGATPRKHRFHPSKQSIGDDGREHAVTLQLLARGVGLQSNRFALVMEP